MKNLYSFIFILTSTIVSTQSWEAKARLSLYKEDGKTHLATDKAFPDRLIVYLSFAGGNISLKLLRNIHLISKEYSAKSEINGTKINEADLLCYYHGHVINSDGNDDVANVALSLCDGLRGSFVMNESWFEIRPENNQVNKWNYANLKREENHMNYSCGFESNRKIPKIPNRKRKRSTLIMDRRIKIVEIVAIIDTSVVVALQNQNAAAHRRCLDIINLANLFFQGLDMFLVLVGVKFHDEQVPDAASSRDYLDNWMKFRIKKLHEYPRHDLGLLLTKKQFGTVVGTALENVMCKLSSAVAFVSDIEPMSVSSATLAHEIGHSFGALHDEDYGGCNCPQKACLLEAVIKNEPDFGWSDCSISVIVGLYETATDICLYNSAEFVGDSVCGDGIVDGREQCDCGRLPSYLCNKDCCAKESCRFVAGKGCSQGSCCDIKQCKVMQRDTICRSKREECDEVEKCDGTSADCPNDRFKANGAMCEGENYCYEGTCVTRDKACSKLYGRKIKASPDSCYAKSTEGTGVFNCGYDPSNFSKVIPCTAQNKMCGALYCDANQDMLHSVFKRYKSIQAFGTSLAMCTVIDFDVFLGVPNLGFVPDGAKCDETKVCLNRNCITRPDFITQTNRRQELSGISQIKYWQYVQSFSIIFILLLVTD